MPAPWDIYVDECKIPDNYCLGFLEVPNTASFMHKLFRCRQTVKPGATVTNEIHWSALRQDTAKLAKRWIDVVFQHRGARFFLRKWARHNSKEVEVIRHLSHFGRRKQLGPPPHDVVVFLDYDSGHARERIQNAIRHAGQIARCYHLDSAKNDCIQCCDLLLGATRIMRDEDFPSLPPPLPENWPYGLPNSEIKRHLAGYLRAKVDGDASCLYDLRPSRRRTVQ